jgi:hypothetical protein
VSDSFILDFVASLIQEETTNNPGKVRRGMWPEFYLYFLRMLDQKGSLCLGLMPGPRVGSAWSNQPLGPDMGAGVKFNISERALSFPERWQSTGDSLKPGCL